MKINLCKFLFILFSIFAFSLNAQTLIIDSTFTSDGEIYPFDTTQAIYGLTVDCSIQLNSDTSLVRIIMVDTNYDEYMLYEAYPLIVSNDTISVEGACDETCYLDSIVPYFLEIQIINANLELDTLNLRLDTVSDALLKRINAKQTVEELKVSQINSKLTQNGLWGADKDSISNLWYWQKKAIFGEKYNLRGLDYYTEGIFTFYGSIIPDQDNSSLVKEFDWRNRHGVNDPNSSYFDENPDANESGNGWMTSIKNQNNLCDNVCWIYAPVAALEGCLNLYFNKKLSQYSEKIHLDMDMSEQKILSCNKLGLGCGTGYTWVSMAFIEDSGLVREECCPNQQLGNSNTASCDTINVCTEPSYLIKTPSGYISHPDSAEEVKKWIIKYGPSCAGVYWDMDAGHGMSLIGFGRVMLGDTIYRGKNLDTLPINDTTHQFYNRNYWLFKNSWGTGGKEYVKMILSYQGNYPYFSNMRSYQTDFENLGSDTNLVRMCLDLDGDGYYNWGIGRKPDAAPYCHDSIDSDDSNPRIGLWDTNFIGQKIIPQIKIAYLYGTANQIDIEPNSVLTLPINDNDTTPMVFHILNEGTAQLNLKEELIAPQEGPIYFEGDDTSYFYCEEPDVNYVQINGLAGDKTMFTIYHLNDTDTSRKIKVRIALDENDMEDFEFYLVMGDCTTIDSTEYITSDTTWGSFNVKFHDVMVCDSSTLVITGTTAFSEGASLKVWQGSRVVLDGGRLTKACDGLWQGVDIYGHSDSSQAYEELHGILEIDNEGTIEYAIVGAETKYLPNVRDYAGGIITGSHANFRNNLRDVKLLPFINTRPIFGEQVDNLCGFSYCNFYTDQYLYNLTWTSQNQTGKL